MGNHWYCDKCNATWPLPAWQAAAAHDCVPKPKAETPVWVLEKMAEASTPKPATAEPPTWKGRPSDIGTWPVQWISIAEAKGRYPAPDPIAEFNERRKAKREKASDIAKAWEHAGHVWSPLAHACVNCGYSEQTLVATQHLPLCADQRQINARDKVFARAMLTPITFTARLGGRT